MLACTAAKIDPLIATGRQFHHTPWPSVSPPGRRRLTANGRDGHRLKAPEHPRSPAFATHGVNDILRARILSSLVAPEDGDGLDFLCKTQ